MNTKRNLLQAFDEVATRRSGDMTTGLYDAMKLARVADMMDVWTRKENDALTKDCERQEEAMLKMAGEIVRLSDRVADLVERGDDMQNELNEANNIIARHEEAEGEWRTTLMLYNDEVNMMIPTRRYEHRVAEDQFGVLHPVMVARQLTREQDEEETMFEGEIIDLTTEEEEDEEEGDLMDAIERRRQDV